MSVVAVQNGRQHVSTTSIATQDVRDVAQPHTGILSWKVDWSGDVSSQAHFGELMHEIPMQDL